MFGVFWQIIMTNRSSFDRLLWPEGLKICLVSFDQLLWPKGHKIGLVSFDRLLWPNGLKMWLVFFDRLLWLTCLKMCSVSFDRLLWPKGLKTCLSPDKLLWPKGLKDALQSLTHLAPDQPLPFLYKNPMQREVTVKWSWSALCIFCQFVNTLFVVYPRGFYFILFFY